jgi:beta-galactosidase GanA
MVCFARNYVKNSVKLRAERAPKTPSSSELSSRKQMSATIASLLLGSICFGQASQRRQVEPASTQMPRIVQKDGGWALMVDGAPYLMLGVQVNNSSAWPGMLPKVWPAAERLHANVVEAPVYWEQIESEKGQFDFSVVDSLIAGAREHRLRLVLLWFGTWKNGAPHYVPEWVKRDTLTYPHVLGVNGAALDTMSPLGGATMAADTSAFRALMRHLRGADQRHTVLMMQVENEINAYGSARDHSPEATRMFEGPVPADFATAMHVNPGTWTESFGAEAENTFQAWCIARYVEQVTKAGKQEYDLPMYLNHSLEDPLRSPHEGRLPWDKMTDHVLDIWKSAAPSLDLIAPDIYMSNYGQYVKVLDVYHRADNAMFIPESGNAAPYARYFFAALGHQAIGWSTFGLDLTGYANAPLGAPVVDEKLIDTFALNFEIAGPMQRQLAQLNFEGKLKAVAEDPENHTQSLDFGPWTATIAYGLRVFGGARNPPGNPEPVGRALVAQLGPDEFLVTGVSARVDFRLTNTASNKRRAFVRVEEGKYVDGKWNFLRIWNGDQTDYGLNFTTMPQVLRVKLGYRCDRID